MAINSSSTNMPKIVFRILWIPMGGFLFLLLNSVGGMKAVDAAVIAYPVCLFGQFMLVAAKYSCKSSPIERTNAWRLLGTHILASVIMGVLWYSLARTFTYMIAYGPTLQGLDQRFRVREHWFFWMASRFTGFRFFIITWFLRGIMR